MIKSKMRMVLVTGVLLLLNGSTARGFTLPSVFAGSDGAFAPSAASTVVDLSLAVTGKWDETTGSGNGVYDPEQWAVIFRYDSVSIPSNVTVSFSNHPSRAPVIWLVEGDVTISGIVALNGSIGAPPSGPALWSEPGPGGFRGGRGARSPSSASSTGMGPGGGPSNSGSGRYGDGTGSYGDAGLFPLIGGSGGGGSATGRGGGAGGGAILIATPGTLTVAGSIRANGATGTSDGPGTQSSGGGSGGGIRLIAETIQGTGLLQAVGASVGRIRIEAVATNLSDIGNPPASFGTPPEFPRIFRVSGDGIPTIRNVTLGGQTIPADPWARVEFPAQDVTLAEEGSATLVIEAENVPPGSTVRARVVRPTGNAEVFTAEYTGDGAEPNQSLWSAGVTVSDGFSIIQVRAELP